MRLCRVLDKRVCSLTRGRSTQAHTQGTADKGVCPHAHALMQLLTKRGTRKQHGGTAKCSLAPVLCSHLSVHCSPAYSPHQPPGSPLEHRGPAGPGQGSPRVPGNCPHGVAQARSSSPAVAVSLDQTPGPWPSPLTKPQARLQLTPPPLQEISWFREAPAPPPRQRTTLERLLSLMTVMMTRTPALAWVSQALLQTRTSTTPH